MKGFNWVWGDTNLRLLQHEPHVFPGLSADAGIEADISREFKFMRNAQFKNGSVTIQCVNPGKDGGSPMKILDTMVISGIFPETFVVKRSAIIVK